MRYYDRSASHHFLVRLKINYTVWSENRVQGKGAALHKNSVGDNPRRRGLITCV